jgi:7 transmembrane receptor (rhodopsin family)
MPIAASTICMLMLSWDRYATVRHPRLTNLRQQRLLPIILSTIAWTGACLVCCPLILVYHISSRPNTTLPASIMSAYEVYGSRNLFCHPDYGGSEVHHLFIIGHTLIVFTLPAFGVLLNHLGVRKKLCALSLTARAAHGELPLPMPILRRPTHMIIVTGMANAARATGVDGHVSSDEERQLGERQCMAETKLRPHVRTPRYP